MVSLRHVTSMIFNAMYMMSESSIPCCWPAAHTRGLLVPEAEAIHIEGLQLSLTHPIFGVGNDWEGQWSTCHAAVCQFACSCTTVDEVRSNCILDLYIYLFFSFQC